MNTTSNIKMTSNRKTTLNMIARTELGQAQLKVGLNFTFIRCRFVLVESIGRFSFLDLILMNLVWYNCFFTFQTFCWVD